MPPTSAEKRHLVGPVGGLADLDEALHRQATGGEERHGEHEPEGLQGDRAEVDLGNPQATAWPEPSTTDTSSRSR